MPYKDQDKQRQAQNVFIWRRRMQWIIDNGPCACGSTQDLVVAFKDPAQRSTKISSIWSRRQEHRDKILADCEVTCRNCHVVKQAKRQAETASWLS